jgi:hypothetical protein
MSNGRPDQNYQRGAGGAVLRGALLLLIAVVLGAVLLQRDKEPSVAIPITDPITTTTAAVVIPDPGITPDPSVGGGETSTTIALLNAPELVKLLVVNGSGVNRAAARVNEFLSKSGYDRLRPTDAVRDGQPAVNYADRVFFNPNHEADARAILSRLGLSEFDENGESIVLPTPPNKFVKDPAPAFDVVIMVGPKLAEKYRTQALPGVAAAASASSSNSGASSSGASTKKKTSKAATAKTTKKTTKSTKAATKTNTDPAPPVQADPAPAPAPDPAPAPPADTRVQVVPQDPQ